MNGGERRGGPPEFSFRQEPARPKSEAAAEMLLNAASKIEGKVFLSGDVRIEGRIIGEVESSGAVTLTSAGSVEGAITASAVTIAGFVKGRVVSSGLVHLCSGAEVEGDLVTARLSIDEGVRFEGSCKMVQPEGENGGTVDLNESVV